MKRILFVEDDQTIALALSYSLREEGYVVEHCSGVKDAQSALSSDFDLVLLDLGLRDGSGYDICCELQGRNIPIVILSAMDDEANIVMGLELGAVDYVTKPFRLRELLTRIRGILSRREKKGSGQLFSLGHVVLDASKARVFIRSEEIALSALEYRLLLLFMQNKGQLLTREQILDHLWDIDSQFVSDNTLSVYIKRIREKIDDTKGELIRTIRGRGYRAGE